MTASHLSREYVDEVQRFLDFCERYASNRDEMSRCPCVKYFNMNRMEPWKIKDHRICNGINKFYMKWAFYGDLENGKNMSAREEVDVEMGNYLEDMIRDFGP